jgi:hypothetical protein
MLRISCRTKTKQPAPCRSQYCTRWFWSFNQPDQRQELSMLRFSLEQKPVANIFRWRWFQCDSSRGLTVSGLFCQCWRTWGFGGWFFWGMGFMCFNNKRHFNPFAIDWGLKHFYLFCDGLSLFGKFPFDKSSGSSSRILFYIWIRPSQYWNQFNSESKCSRMTVFLSKVYYHFNIVMAES